MSTANSGNDGREHDPPDAIEIPAALDGERIDRVVATLTDRSRASAARAVADGSVLVDGRAVAKSYRVAAGELLEIGEEEARDEVPTPEDLPLTVRYEDDDVVVVAKSAGVVVHPGAGNRTGTLVSGLLYRYPEMASVGDRVRPGIVHRLDRDTSGLMVVARTETARVALMEAMAERRVEREYVALVWGHLDAPKGLIDAPIGRSAHRRTRMAVRESGRPARTRYEVESVFERPPTSLLRLQLETGRTHQIRVHLSAVGHPVVGDGTYGGRRDSLAAERPLLHSARLVFDHPISGQRIEVTEPLPGSIRAVLDGLE